jgi:hypothetical protein
MLPGHFLGIARTTGDTFTFIIETEGKIRNMALQRSIIKRRDPKNKDPYADYNRGEPESLPKDAYDLENIDHNSKSDDDRIIQETSHEEIILDSSESCQSESIIHVGDGNYNEEYTNEIYNHVDEEVKCQDIKDIYGSNFSESDGKLYLDIRWNDGRESKLDAEKLQLDDPLRLAKYIRDNPVERLRGGFWSQWVERTLRSISNTTNRIRRMYHCSVLSNNYYLYS